MAEVIRELYIDGAIAGFVSFPEIGAPTAFSVGQIDAIMSILTTMAATNNGQPLFNLGLFGTLGLHFEQSSNGSKSIVHRDIFGIIDKLTIKIDFDEFTEYTYVNQYGVLEYFTLERIVIHEAIHALTGDGTNDVAVTSDLLSPTPNFQGDTVNLTNDILDEIHGSTFADRMHYVNFIDSIDFHYGDAPGEVMAAGVSLTNGVEISNVYRGRETGNNNDSIGGSVGVDLLLGLSGDDTFIMTGGADWVYGGPGTDTISYSLPGQTDLPDGVELLILELGAITWLSGGFGVQDNFFSIERIIGTTVDDTFSYLDDLSAFPLTEIDGSGGTDTFDLSDRTDAAVFTIGSGTGEVNLSSFERVILSGLNDELTLASLDDLSGFDLSGNSLAVILDGGAGTDILRLTGAVADLNLNILNPQAHQIIGFEEIYLDDGDTIIHLNLTDNPDTYSLIDAGDGIDTLDVSATTGVIDLTLGDGTGGSLNLVGVEEIVLGALGDTVHFTANDVVAGVTSIDGGAGAEEWRAAPQGHFQEGAA